MGETSKFRFVFFGYMRQRAEVDDPNKLRWKIWEGKEKKLKIKNIIFISLSSFERFLLFVFHYNHSFYIFFFEIKLQRSVSDQKNFLQNT